MWEHASALIGVPAAIKATLEIIKMLNPAPGKAEPAQQAAHKLESVYAAVASLATDAAELAAFKDLHALTNQFQIDLKDSFAMVNPDPDRARDHWYKLAQAMKGEFMAMREGQRAAAQLDALRANAELMSYLEIMPEDVLRQVNRKSWDKCFLDLLRDAEASIENFGDFYIRVEKLRKLNSVLNNFADRSLKQGIGELDRLMSGLRKELQLHAAAP